MAPRISKCEQGFSIVEALIAGSLILTGLIASLALINSSIRLAIVAKDELVGANLAQEGIEIVRSFRDANWIAGRLFDENFTDGNHRVHYLDSAFLPYVDTALLFDQNTGFYQYAAGVETPFRRRIRISHVSPSEVRVISRVDWTTRGIPYSVRVEDHLFDWLPD